jgi:hypothetical protein
VAGRADGIKPPVAGVVAINQLPAPPLRQDVSAVVIEVAWRDLQPNAAPQVAANNPIDQALASVRQADAADGMTRGIRVRLLAGIDSPDWLKAIDGPPVSMSDPQGGASGTVPRFWLPDFGTRYAQLQQLLAARYDSALEIREVTVSRCMTIFAEPFQRQASSSADVQALLAAGYSLSLDQTCQQEAVAAHSVWRTTRSSLALTPYQAISSNGAVGQDMAFTDQMVQYCRATLRNQCVLQNNSIRYPSLGGNYPQMYQDMVAAGRPIAFQTAASSRVGDLSKTLDWAVSEGAGAVELLNQMIQSEGATLAQYDTELRSNDSNC